jgi:hypothetical protein
MKVLTVLVVLLLTVLSAFALLNWKVVAAPSPLSIAVTTVNAPLGLILLGATGLVTALFLAYVIQQQAAALLEARRFARDLHAQRDLADKAEASRFTDLRAFLDAELRSLERRRTAELGELNAQLARVQELLGARLSEVSNGLAAHVAEVEDKVDRILQVKAG